MTGWMLLILLASSSGQAYEVADSMNAMMLSMKAKSLVGHQETTSPPGYQRNHLQMRRGGPRASHHQQEAGCGGVAIGNVRPVIGDHRSHQTTVIIQGHILNTGNRC